MASKWLLGQPVIENLLQGIVTDSIKENAEFQYKSGMQPKIVRRTDGNCCEWCSRMAGEYTYPDCPPDVYRRHNNCNCTVEYYPGDGMKQDVWSRKWSESSELRESRKKVGLKEQDPGVLALRRQVGLKETGPEELERRKQIGLENTGEKSIIKSRRAELEKYIGKPITKTDNKSIREWYVANVSDIPNQIDKSKPLEEQAKQAYELRNKYKREARVAMSDKKTANILEKRHSIKTIDELIKHKMEGKGLSREEALEDILNTDSKTNTDINKKFGL